MARRVEPDIIRRYREWIDHRYDPGYWTGGYLLPCFRRFSYNRRGRRRLGYFVLFYALIYLLGVVSTMREFAALLDARVIVFSLIFSLAWPTLLLALGLKLLKTPGPAHERTDGRLAESK